MVTNCNSRILVVAAAMGLVVAGSAQAQEFCDWTGTVSLTPGITPNSQVMSLESEESTVSCNGGPELDAPFSGTVDGNCASTVFSATFAEDDPATPDVDESSEFKPGESFGGTSVAVLLQGVLADGQIVGAFYVDGPDQLCTEDAPIEQAEFHIVIALP